MKPPLDTQGSFPPHLRQEHLHNGQGEDWGSADYGGSEVQMFYGALQQGRSSTPRIQGERYLKVETFYFDNGCVKTRCSKGPYVQKEMSNGDAAGPLTDYESIAVGEFVTLINAVKPCLQQASQVVAITCKHHGINPGIKIYIRSSDGVVRSFPIYAVKKVEVPWAK